MSLPNPSLTFSPFDILTAEEMNDLVENDQALSNGTGFQTGGINAAVVLQDNSVTAAKLSLGSTTDANGWGTINLGNIKIYYKNVTISGSWAAGVGFSGNTNNLPVGYANITALGTFRHWLGVTGQNSEAAGLSAGLTGSNTNVIVYGINTLGTSVTYNMTVTVFLLKM